MSGWTSLIAQTSVSAWDKTAALGQSFGAAATFMAIAAAFVIGRKDREAASQSARQAQDSAARSASEALAANEDARRREHKVDLLLRLSDAAARVEMYRRADPGREARAIGRGLVLALPETWALPATLKTFMPGVEFEGIDIDAQYDAVYGASENPDVPAAHAGVEITRLIREMSP